MRDMQVKADNMYNTTPTPSPNPSASIPPQNTQSTHTSMKPKCSCLQSFFSLFSGVWSWIKKNIFCTKKKEAFSSNFRFMGNPVRCLSSNMLPELVRAKKENPKQFLENIVEWFMKDPKAFSDEHIKKLPDFPEGSEQEKIVIFMRGQCNQWNKSRNLDALSPVIVQVLYAEFDGDAKKKAAIGRFVIEINEKYRNKFEYKPNPLRVQNLYDAGERGDTERLRQLNAD